MLVCVNADQSHQGQRVPVSADQNMLSVVQRQALVCDAARPPAGLRGGFQQAYLPARVHRVNRGRQSGPATADDGDLVQKRPSACIFQAIQSLRTGVSDTRWFSTGNCAA